MKKIISGCGYVLFFAFILAVDFLSKQWALKTLIKEVPLNDYFSMELVINRGVSWGIFHHATQPFFIALSIAISLLIVILAGYTVFQFIRGFSVYAELLVLAGATGNLIDRSLYNGVVDFVVFHVGGIYLPTFNVADAAIVVGVACMFAALYE